MQSNAGTPQQHIATIRPAKEAMLATVSKDFVDTRTNWRKACWDFSKLKQIFFFHLWRKKHLFAFALTFHNYFSKNQTLCSNMLWQWTPNKKYTKNHVLLYSTFPDQPKAFKCSIKELQKNRRLGKCTSCRSSLQGNINPDRLKRRGFEKQTTGTTRDGYRALS